MRGLWSEANWRLERDALVLPNGHRLRLASIRDWRENLVTGQHDFTGKWSGWRVRQQWLIPPGGTMRRGRIAERALRHFAQAHEWDLQERSRRQFELFPT